MNEDIWQQQIELAKNGGYVQPTHGDVHVDHNMANVLVAFLQDQTNFVASRVFPFVPVRHKSNTYPILDRGSFNRNQVKKRAPGTRAPLMNWTTSPDSYISERRSIANPVYDEIRDNADSNFQMDRIATEAVTRQGLIEMEVDWVTNYFADGQTPGTIWTFVADGVASGATAEASFDPRNGANNNVLHWSDPSSTPIEDVTRAIDEVMEETGMECNILTLGRRVFSKLMHHPDFVARIDRGQTNGVAKVNREAMASLFGVEEVLVTGAIQNTAAEGLTATHSFIGGKHALLSYRPQNPGLMVPTAGYNFTWTGFLGATNNGMRIRRKRDDLSDTDLFELDMHYDNKLVSADLGYFFNGIIA